MGAPETKDHDKATKFLVSLEENGYSYFKWKMFLITNYEVTLPILKIFSAFTCDV